MSEHLEKLVHRFFHDLGIPGQFLWRGNVSVIKCGSPTDMLFRCGLVVRIDETDGRPIKKRMRYTHNQPMLIIRQPQELLKKETLGWLKKVVGYELHPETLPDSLLQKIKHYRADYHLPSRGYRMRRAIQKSKRLQKAEKKFHELRLMVRRGVKSN